MSSESPTTCQASPDRGDNDDAVSDRLKRIEGLLKLLVTQGRSIGDQKSPHRRSITIARLCRVFCRHADDYYPKPIGQRTTEAMSIRHALVPLLELHAKTPVNNFGPRKLIRVRERMIERGWCRRQINHQIGRIKRMFKWAVENEWVSPDRYHAVQSVAGLRQGRSKAIDHPPVMPVPEAAIAAVLPFVGSPVQAMIHLQLLTGMRPGEVVSMRTSDLDRTGEAWIYRPAHHKTEHHGHERIVFLGPQSQAILGRFIAPLNPRKFLFSPADTDAERRLRLSRERKTPLSYGNRPGTNRRKRPVKQPGECYVTGTYARAIRYGCARAYPIPSGSSKEEAGGEETPRLLRT